MSAWAEKRSANAAVMQAVMRHGFSDVLSQKIAKELVKDGALQKEVSEVVAGSRLLREEARRLRSPRGFQRLTHRELHLIACDVRDRVCTQISQIISKRVSHILNTDNCITQLIATRIRHETKMHYQGFTRYEAMKTFPKTVESVMREESESEEETNDDEDDRYGDPWRPVPVVLDPVPAEDRRELREKGELEKSVYEMYSRKRSRSPEELHTCKRFARRRQVKEGY